MANDGAEPLKEELEQGKDARSVLAEYERHKHDIAQVLRETRAAAYQQKNDGLERAIGEVTRKLAEDRFYLIVVGQFSRGKSTLMNAILGKEYLPSGILPTTSAVTAVSYGSREKVVLRRSQSNLTREIRISELADFVTERVNPGNREGIEMAEVQVPVEILRRGFFFVDTPGLGSAIRENTATTLNFLPSADAIVFVTSCDSPMAAGEVGYLRQCKSSVRQIFLVVNKMDLASEADGRNVIEFVKAKAQEELDATVRVYAASARAALAARQEGDSATLEQSGLPELEEELVAYLVSQRHKDFLLRACDRAAELLLANRIPEGEELLRRIGILRRELGDNLAGKVPEGEAATSVAAGGSLLKVSCAVCDRIVDRVYDFLRTYQYDLYVSAEVQRAHAETGGFCPMHTWQYANLASPQGICGAYPQLLLRFSQDLRCLAEEHAAKRAAGGVSGVPLPADGACPACLRAGEAEKSAVLELAEGWKANEDGRERRQRYLCLTHLEQVLLVLRDTSAERDLLIGESDALRRLAENLQRYALKHEGRRSDLITEEEWQAPKQALVLVAGHRNVRPRFGR